MSKSKWDSLRNYQPKKQVHSENPYAMYMKNKTNKILNKSGNKRTKNNTNRRVWLSSSIIKVYQLFNKSSVNLMALI